MLKRYTVLSILLNISCLWALIERPVSFSEWRDACFDQLPEYDHPLKPGKSDKLIPILALSELNRSINGALEEIYFQYYEPEQWTNNVFPEIPAPFIQKIIVEPQTTIYIQGDIHGSLHSLLRNLDRLKDKGLLNDAFKVRKDVYLFFLGDYSDRGRYSIEVLYTLARLKENSPENIFLIRGNHEDIEMGERDGFEYEMSKKYGSDGIEFFTNDIDEIFSLLPLGIFVGTGTPDRTNYIFLCHGIPAIGYNPQQLLTLNNHKTGIYYSLLNFDEDLLERQKTSYPPLSIIYEFYKSQIIPFHELNWGDISTMVDFSEIRGCLTFPPDFIYHLLDSYSVKDKQHYVHTLFRGHQHAEIGNGCFDENLDYCPDIGIKQPLLTNSIYTLISAPEGIGGGSATEYDSFVLVETAEAFSDWKITPYQFMVPLAIDKKRGYYVSKKYNPRKEKMEYRWTLKIGLK